MFGIMENLGCIEGWRVWDVWNYGESGMYRMSESLGCMEWWRVWRMYGMVENLEDVWSE